ncbi:MAG TPA: translocation/assembly module TamB domain-containing protein, partial [Candidatus Acidoferrum sp.]|nr:translocation/assembly module TamB domain-containing protein [Candidatus Acidoferrum sp.]
HLNLAPLMQNDSMKTDLNFHAKLLGSGFDTSKFKAAGQLELSSSELYHTKIDTAFARVSYAAKLFRIDTLYAQTPFARAGASGKGEINGDNDLRYWVKLDNLSELRSMLTADSLGGIGTVSGTAMGTLDSLQILSDLDFHNLKYNTLAIEALQGHLAVLKHKDDISGAAKLQAKRLGTISFVLDSLAATSQFTEKSADVTIDAVYQPGINGHVETKMSFDSASTISIPNLALSFKEQHWKGGGPDTRVTFKNSDYRIDYLTLTSPSDSGGGLQSVSVNGLFSQTGSEDLRLKIDRLDLARLTAAFDLPSKIAGFLSSEAQLTGTASEPHLAGNVNIDKGTVNQFSYQALHSNFGYAPTKLTWSLSLLPYQADSLAMSGFVPMTLSPAKSEGAIHRDQPFEIKVKTAGLPLSIIQASGQPFKQVMGFIVADMNIGGTINSPAVTGTFGLRDGQVSLPKYGVEYSDIMTRISIHDAVLTLDTLQAKRDQGFLTGSGTLQFEKSLLSGTIKTTQFDFVADKFYVVNHKDYQVQISGNAELTGNSVEPKFAGNITILRSSLFLPALMEEAAAAQAAADKSEPLLVKATAKPDTLTDSTGAMKVAKRPEIDTSQIDWYKNLRGQFKVTIPRNTWLRSPDMNLEIGEGDIDLVKNGPDFEIFGPIKILRGQYNLYGKRFTILQGDLLFQGGREYNPKVSMQAQYVFRTAEREKKTLKLDVSGKAFNPVLQFTLDDNAIEERDAIAYVMYGRSMDELTSGQKSDAGAAQGELAKGAAANMLSNELSQTLGSKLGLDVVDINSQGILASATVTVGKYLTNDLFMSYQRALGQSQDPGTTPEIITLEYELNKFLSVQLLQGDEKTSGFDFIFKYQH